MEPIKYEPFSGPREFSYLIAALFNLYWSCPSDLFFFDWLQRTPDLKVVCKETTGEEVDFPTPPALETAIQNCAKINSPVLIPGAHQTTTVGLVGWGWQSMA